MYKHTYLSFQWILFILCTDHHKRNSCRLLKETMTAIVYKLTEMHCNGREEMSGCAEFDMNIN